MSLTKYIKLFFLTFLLAVYSYNTQARTRITAERIYGYARDLNYDALSQIGRYIDVTDGSGYTALCKAIADDNQHAYYTLRRFGANPKPRCLSSALSANHSAFNGPVFNVSSGTWTALGVAAVGGGIIAAASGGGGGGGGDNDKCPGYGYNACGYGYEETSTCFDGDNTRYICKLKEGYIDTDGTITCAHGYSRADENAECLANTCDGYDYDSCQNWQIVDSSCLTPTATKYKCSNKEGFNDDGSCKIGYTLTDGNCVAQNCGAGFSTDTCKTWQTSETCQSGTETQYKCTNKEGFNDDGSCKTGYTPSGDSCVADTCDGFSDSVTCQNWQNTTTCQSGSDTKYKCVNKEGFDDDGKCLNGYSGINCTADTCDGFSDSVTCQNWQTQTTCQSGSDTKYKCVNKEGFGDDGSCLNGYSGTDCAANTCDGFSDSVTCQSWQTQTTCQSGATEKYKCENNPGYNDDGSCASGYGKNGSGACVIKGADIYGTKNGDDITIENTEYADVYGIYTTTNGYNANSNVSATISIGNKSDGNVYGVASAGNDARVINAYDGSMGKITINNTGNGNVYGLKANTASNANDGAAATNTEGTINIINNGNNGNIYGVYANTNAVNTTSHRAEIATATGKIQIFNDGNGNLYGVYGKTATNSESTNPIDGTGHVDASIHINNNGSGKSYGLYATDTAQSISNTTGKNVAQNSSITMVNKDPSGTAYGIYADKSKNITDAATQATSLIEMANAEVGTIIGMYGKTLAENSGTIKLHNLESGTAIGMYIDGGTATNSGSIIIDREEYDDTDIIGGGCETLSPTTPSPDGIAIGIYGAAGSTISNSGTISISDAGTAYGILGEDSTVTVNNTGTITIDGNSQTNNSTIDGKFINLNGGTILNSGSMVSETSLNLAAMNANVIATQGAQFSAQNALIGNVTMSSDIVSNGFDTTYKVADMVKAADLSDFRLSSGSALFDAQLENGTDAVLSMKSFSSVLEDDEASKFLQNNYAAANNEKLFAALKSASTSAELNERVSSLFGKDMFSRMAYEDLSMLREVNFDMNQKFLAQTGSFSFGGQFTPTSFNNSNGSIGRYSVNGYSNGNMSLGFGMAISDISSHDGHDDNRRFDRSFVMSLPIGFRAGGMEFITSPKLGYSYGTYDREGYENVTYNGKVQKRIFALMNEAKYPLTYGNAKIIPTAEFNLIGYNIKANEDDNQYALKINSQNHYSVEAGIGLMSEKEFALNKNSHLKFNGGVMVYQEFANPYELDISMSGMEGTYRLQDEKRGDNRAALRFGMDYKVNNSTSVSANLLTNIDHEYRTDAGINLKYAF